MWTSMKGRKFTMKFIPEKAKIVNGIALIVIATMIIMFVILKESENILTKSLMFILIGSVLVVGGFFLAFLKTLYYEIKDETLKKRAGEIPKVKIIIKKHIDAFMEWHQMRKHVPILKVVKDN